MMNLHEGVGSSPTHLVTTVGRALPRTKASGWAMYDMGITSRRRPKGPAESLESLETGWLGLKGKIEKSWEGVSMVRREWR